ncbi:MAG: alpha-amylase family protein [Planctomycetota bacterium]
MTTQAVLKPMPIGTVYLIDPTLSADQRRRDLENIRNTGFNTVVLWPAATRWDAAHPGGVAFDSIDRVMDDCAELGLGAVVELQGQQVHQEMTPHSHPAMPAVAKQGHKRSFNWNHPDFQKATLTYIEQVAEHFLGHPALLAYDIFNEVGNANTDEWTRRQFVPYLRERYDADLAALNHHWGACFADFDAIAEYTPEHLKTLGWWSVVPQRDWYAFRHQNFIDLLDEWTAAVRRVDEDTPVFADVLGCDTQQNRDGWYYGVNDWDIAEHSDVLGLSCYANMLPQPYWETQGWAWPMFWRTADAAARGKQVVISEMMTSNRSLLPTESSTMTDEVGLWSAQAFFHGVDGLIYWKWRPFRRGEQVGGRGLTDNDGTPNEQAQQAAAVAAWVDRLGDRLLGLRPDHAGCAILFDHNTQHLLSAIGQVPPDIYTDSAMGWFEAFWRRGVAPTFLAGRLLTADGVPDDIRVLVVPCGVAISQAQADRLTAFIERGGTLLTESRFGLIDEQGNLWDHAPGAGLNKKLAFTEKRLNARYTGGIEALGLRLENELVQDRLETTLNTQTRLAFDDGTPLLLELRHAASPEPSEKLGAHHHVTMLLGRAVRRQILGALAVFNAMFDAVAGPITTGLRWQPPGPDVDVSVLVDDAGVHRMVGITNFQHHVATVDFQSAMNLTEVVPTDAASVSNLDHGTRVMVPPRTAALLVLSDGDTP